MNIQNTQFAEQKKLADVELIRQIGLQDKEALHELYTRYNQSLGGFLRSKLNEPSLVDELYNDVMFTIWQNADKFRGDSKVSTWIFGIAYRLVLAAIRKNAKHANNTSEMELDQMPAAEPSNPNTEFSSTITNALQKLSSDHRTVIELTYIYGHSLNELAEIMDCPLNTAKTRLFHARQNLKSQIDNGGHAAATDTNKSKIYHEQN